MRIIAVIPARFASTRLPGKPLANIHGRPMIQWVYERVRACRILDRVIVATDDVRILSAVKKFGGEARMTDSKLPSGTDRVAAIADDTDGDIYVNVQGDEPMIEPTVISQAVELITSGRFKMGTVMSAIHEPEDLTNPAVVKVIADCHDRAIYFSRHPIPYSRGVIPQAGERFACHRHIGLYTYTRDMLFRLRALPPSPLEQGEMLEQLRALEEGIPIGIRAVKYTSIGVDTPEDLERVKKLIPKR